MGRRKVAKGVGYYVPLTITPILVVVLTPLYLHSVAKNHLQITDVHVFGAFLCMLGISLLSLLGCALDKGCQCSKGFPMAVLSLQLFLVFATLMASLQFVPPLPHSSAQQQGPGVAKGSAGFLHGPLLSEMGTGPSDLLAQPLATAPGGAAAAPVPAASAASDPSIAVAVAAAAPAALPGWVPAGNGYCEDSQTHQEFNSLYRNGVTLAACASSGLKDPACIALDFSADDGGCDLRYPAEALAQDMDGYAWFGYGAGAGSPAASGLTKHGLETQCYTKVRQAAQGSPSAQQKRPLTTDLHPYYKSLIREYSFRPMRTNTGQYANIILVHSPLSDSEQKMFDKFKDELLFIGIMSLEDFPLPPPNPFSPKFPKDKFVGMFPGFLNMYREPEKIFPSNVKVLDMSQSDFSLPGRMPPMVKKWDFTLSGSDQDIGEEMESDCVGWSMFAKNWTFAKQAFDVMCSEFGMTGVLVATKDKQDVKRCKIPQSCEGKLLQTTYISQDQFWSYVRQSKFLFLPQVHDASPRVATQALALDVPLLMNKNIIGGWKYVTEKTGEYFNDLSDLRDSIRRLQRNIESGGVYEPRKWVTTSYGDDISGRKLFDWVQENFQDRVKLPRGTQKLYPVS